MPTCNKCEKVKDDADFYVYKKTGKRWGRCKACVSEANCARAAADPEKHNARSKAWRDKNPGRASAISRAWQLRHPEKAKSIAYKVRYQTDFQETWDAQAGNCALCGLPMKPSGRDPDSACMDHDRSCCSERKSCGKCVRGLVHWNCNVILGHARDDADLLRKAAEYLERWKGKTSPIL